eukprot:TRINITY_DN34524_c0_g1_i1.p1 TRINITY_DN34524_c0_g1~~TRINITY_DN34524_c0_g1_i1.p1  ORF type:complete len:102 (-),score=1.21 TRINITY_DN34524_c0_g1_i1:50-355(-)
MSGLLEIASSHSLPLGTTQSMPGDHYALHSPTSITYTQKKEPSLQNLECKSSDYFLGTPHVLCVDTTAYHVLRVRYQPAYLCTSCVDTTAYSALIHCVTLR